MHDCRCMFVFVYTHASTRAYEYKHTCTCIYSHVRALLRAIPQQAPCTRTLPAPGHSHTPPNHPHNPLSHPVVIRTDISGVTGAGEMSWRMRCRPSRVRVPCCSSCGEHRGRHRGNRSGGGGSGRKKDGYTNMAMGRHTQGGRARVRMRVRMQQGRMYL